MVGTDFILDIGDQNGINVFDVINYFGFGDGTDEPQISDTTLSNELFRNLIVEKVKDLGDYTYEITGRLPITQANGADLSEVGVFNAITGGDMGGRVLLDDPIAKTSDDEYLITIKIKTKTINI